MYKKTNRPKKTHLHDEYSKELEGRERGELQLNIKKKYNHNAESQDTRNSLPKSRNT